MKEKHNGWWEFHISFPATFPYKGIITIDMAGVAVYWSDFSLYGIV